MTAIKQIIFRQWYRFFFTSCALLYLILTMANLISGLLRSGIKASDVLANHLVETPEYLKLIFPISCLVATLFAINKLKDKNELTAILSVGYSRKKFIFTIAQAAFFMSVLQFFILSYVSPFLKSKRHHWIENSGNKFKNLRSKGLRASTIGTGSMWYKNEKYFLTFETYNKRNQSLSNVTAYFYHFPSGSESPSLSKILKSPKTFYTSQKRWVSKEIEIIENLDRQEFPQVKKIKGQDYRLPILETAQDFKQIEADITTLNIVQLFSYIKKLHQNKINVNEYLILFLEKISVPLTGLLFSLLSTTTLFQPSRRNSQLGKNLIFIFSFTIAYWLIHNYSIQLGASSKINPFLSCFIIPFLFSSFLAVVFYQNRKLR